MAVCNQRGIDVPSTDEELEGQGQTSDVSFSDDMVDVSMTSGGDVDN
jgi:hypothetical protein